MDTRVRTSPIRDRVQWVTYGFLAGLVAGIVLGWIFNRAVSWLFGFGIFLLILIPLVLIFMVWRWWATRDDESQVVVYESSDRQPDDRIEAHGRIVDTDGGTAER